MAASTRFRNLSSIALFASLMTIPVAPAFAQTLSYQPADRGLAFPQYAPQPGNATPSTDEMPAALRRQVVSYQGNEAAGTVIVDTAHTYLYLILGGGKAMRYGIGVGREGFTWSGTQTITRNAEWPDWMAPAAGVDRAPAVSAALGRRRPRQSARRPRHVSRRHRLPHPRHQRSDHDRPARFERFHPLGERRRDRSL